MTQDSIDDSVDLVKAKPFFKKKRYIALALVVLYLAITGIINLPKVQAESRYGKLATAEYVKLKKRCFDVTNHSTVIGTGTARSKERIAAVNAFYGPVVTSPCLILGDEVFVNIYNGSDFKVITTAPFASEGYKLFQGILFDVDYGFSQFTPYGTICADGSMSGSVGRGTCSWHGGYAHARGNNLDFSSLPKLTNPENAERPDKYGVSWLLDDPTPLPSSLNKTQGTTCIKAAEGVAPCFPKTSWNRTFCSVSQHAYLEIFIEKTWFPVDSITGSQSNSCSAENPYLISYSATSLLQDKMRMRFPETKNHKEFKSYFEIAQF